MEYCEKAVARIRFNKIRGFMNRDIRIMQDILKRLEDIKSYYERYGHNIMKKEKLEYELHQLNLQIEFLKEKIKKEE